MGCKRQRAPDKMVECGGDVSPEVCRRLEHVAAEDETVDDIEYACQEYVGHHPAPELLYVEIAAGEHQQRYYEVDDREIAHYLGQLYLERYYAVAGQYQQRRRIERPQEHGAVEQPVFAQEKVASQT